MAKHTYILTDVTVKGGKFKVDKRDITVGETILKAHTETPVIEDNHGRLTPGEDGKYSFTALTGGEFRFIDANNASITAFDGFAVTTAIKITVDSTNNAELKNITTGSAKDIVSVKEVTAGTFDLGAGNDSIDITKGTATVTLGDGKDTISIADEATTAVKINDYSYADDTVILKSASAASLKMNYSDSMFTVKGTTGSTVSVGTTMNNGVYELKLSTDDTGNTATHFVRTNVSSVDYVAKDAINFESDANTTALNLTLAGKSAEKNTVSVGATEGTVNIVAGKAQADITVDAGVDLGLGIAKNGSVVSVTSALDAKDTLYLVDGGKLDELTFDTTGDATLKYGSDAAKATAKVVNAFTKGSEGSFNYNINGKTGVLRYGTTSGATNGTVTYTKGVSYYANAATVDASDYGDVVLNLNGYSDDAFAAGINTIAGVTSGLVAGRNNEATTIKLATEANKKTEVYGGVGGADTIDASAADEESTNVIWYSNGDGKDSVTGFDKGNNSIYFHDATAAASVLNDALTVDGNGTMTLTLTKGKDELTLDKTQGKTIDFKDAAGNNFKVAVGDGTTVNYAAGVNIYKGATTLKVSGSDDLILYTGANNDQYGYFNGITKIDAAEANGTVALSGSNVNGMEIQGGTGVNNMWGGGDKVQTLIGGEGVNVFWFGNGDGRDTAKNAKAEDGINLYNVEKIDDVAVKASTNYFTVTVGSNALKVDVGSADAATVLEKFTFADKAGVLYTYNTKTNKFQQK